MRERQARRASLTVFLWGTVLGGVAAAAALELPYVNWRRIAPPIDASPLTIRQDAKGDGRFLASRSGRRRHRGVDLAAAVGTPVRAIRSGTVVEVGAHRGLGRFVEVEHPGHFHSVYAHLNEVSVGVGDRVRQGALIGTVGKTGNARHPWMTPHLHLEVLQQGAPIDPQIIGLDAVAGAGDSSDASGGE